MGALLGIPRPRTGEPAWQVRTEDARVQFHGKASRFAPTVQAGFTRVSGTVSADAVDVDVDVRSVTTGNAAYDDLLTAADPFDAARHPVATYRSESVRWLSDAVLVTGLLSMRGRTAVVDLTASYVEVADGLARLTATGRVDRRELGLRLELPGLSALVPAHLDLRIDVTAVRTEA